jgi:hypothetical protein
MFQAILFLIKLILRNLSKNDEFGEPIFENLIDGNGKVKGRRVKTVGIFSKKYLRQKL